MTNSSIIGALAPVVLQKACCLNPLMPAPSGLEKPLSDGYCIRGILLTKLQAGESICIFRTHKNGREIPGIFRSSAIVEIQDELVIRTKNSLWIILPLEPGSVGPSRQNLLFMGVKGGLPVQCRLCGCIVRSIFPEQHAHCSCGLTMAPIKGSSREDLPQWAENSIARFVDPRAFKPKSTRQEEGR